VPVVLDWRDYEAVAQLVGCCPVLPCRGCGEPITLDLPVVVVRPGDPIRWMVGVPPVSSQRHKTAAAGLVDRVRAMANELPADQPIQVSHDVLVTVVDRYSGFDLARIGHDGTPAGPVVDDRFGVIRTQVAVPDVPAILLDLLGAADEDEVHRTCARYPELVDASWAPVFRAVGRSLVAQLDTPEAVRLARFRLVEVGRRRWRKDPVPPDSWQALDKAAQAVLSRAHDLATLTNSARRVVFEQIVQLIEDRPEHRAFLTEEFLVFFVRLYESPERTPEDLEIAVPAGLIAVQRAQDVFGPDHPMTLLAINDLGAALLDRQRGDPHSAREQAIELLTAAAAAAARAADPVLADLLHNLGVAYAHLQHGGRSANQQRAEECFSWSQYLAQVLTPDQPRSIVQGRLNIAALLRERRSGNRLAATAQALAVYDSVLVDPGLLSVLGPAEQILARSNRVAALYQLHQLNPDAVDAADVVAAAEEVAAACLAAPVGDPQSLSNVGSVLGSLYHDMGFTQPDLLARAVELTATAYAVARAGHTPAHPDVLRIGLNHAAMLGMPVIEDVEQPDGSSAVRYFDGVAAQRLLAELLEVCPADRFPAHTAAIANNLGRYQFSVGQFAAACGSFRTAIAAIDRLYRATADPEHQLAELGVPGEPLSWSSVVGWLVSASLRANDPAGAVAAVEESRNKLLADKLRVDLPQPPPGPRQTDGPVLYVGVSAVGSWVILIPPRGRSRFLESALFAGDLRPMIDALRAAGDVAARSSALGAITAALRPHITGPAFALLVTNATTDLAVVASGLLSGLPLHALPASDDGRCWLDLASVRYLPSAATARHIESRPASHREAIVAVASPELGLARHEAALLGQALGPVQSPPPGDRRSWLLTLLPQISHLLLSCHARWLDDDPLRSRIELDSQNLLCLEDLLAVTNAAPDLVVASCCVTGVTVEVLADEILGFGTGMLLAGARAAVVSNWELGDRVSALTLAVFYQELGRRTQPAAALRAAQQWLRRLTVADLLALGDGLPAQGRYLDLPRGLRRELSALRYTAMIDNLAGHPYADPASWGGYCCYGARAHDSRDGVDGPP